MPRSSANLFVSRRKLVRASWTPRRRPQPRPRPPAPPAPSRSSTSTRPSTARSRQRAARPPVSTTTTPPEAASGVRGLRACSVRGRRRSKCWCVPTRVVLHPSGMQHPVPRRCAQGDPSPRPAEQAAAQGGPAHQARPQEHVPSWPGRRAAWPRQRVAPRLAAAVDLLGLDRRDGALGRIRRGCARRGPRGPRGGL